MSTKPSSPELRPNRYDALVVLVVLALAAALAVRPFFAARAPQSGALTVVVSADGQELDRLPLAQFGTHTYANNGYTLTVTAAGGAVSVTQSDCPGQDCVHSGVVSRAGAEHRVPARAHRGGAGRRRRRLRPRDGLGGAV